MHTKSLKVHSFSWHLLLWLIPHYTHVGLEYQHLFFHLRAWKMSPLALTLSHWFPSQYFSANMEHPMEADIFSLQGHQVDEIKPRHMWVFMVKHNAADWGCLPHLLILARDWGPACWCPSSGISTAGSLVSLTRSWRQQCMRSWSILLTRSCNSWTPVTPEVYDPG